MGASYDMFRIILTDTFLEELNDSVAIEYLMNTRRFHLLTKQIFFPKSRVNYFIFITVQQKRIRYRKTIFGLSWARCELRVYHILIIIFSSIRQEVQ